MKSKFYNAIIFLCFLLLQLPLHAQKKIKALFIGNSYTYSNNLPQLIQSLALVNGDTLQWDANTPGGYTLQMHSNDATTLSKIATGGWDVVILQAQSQEPSFDSAYVVSNVFPFARKLDSLIHVSDSCVETVFFMTWGRKNGDAGNCAAYPPVCTYAGMQGKLRERYLQMGAQNQATVAPVGCVWREVVNQNQIFDLYQSDQSHPSVYGSYLAACVFYELLFQKNVVGNSFISTLSAADATAIQQATNHFFSDSLSVFASNGDIPFSTFSVQQNGNQIQCLTSAINVNNYLWSFGDGNISMSNNPTHVYQNPGTYTVTLTVTNASGCMASTSENVLTVLPLSFNEVQQKNYFVYVNDKNELVIQGLTSGVPCSIRIFSVRGELIYASNFLTAPTVSLPSMLSSGIYLVELSAGEVLNRFRFYNP
jgi:PKD domain